MKIVFVCHGNTCRSPMAEVIFRDMVSDIEVTSAGLSASNGQRAAYNAIRVCEYNGLDLKRHKSRNFHDLKIEDDDLILTLTEDIRDNLKERYLGLEIYTVKEYAGEEEYLDIKDPYGGDLSIYEICFDEIKENLMEIAKIHFSRKEELPP